MSYSSINWRLSSHLLLFLSCCFLLRVQMPAEKLDVKVQLEQHLLQRLFKMWFPSDWSMPLLKSKLPAKWCQNSSRYQWLLFWPPHSSGRSEQFLCSDFMFLAFSWYYFHTVFFQPSNYITQRTVVVSPPAVLQFEPVIYAYSMEDLGWTVIYLSVNIG